MPIVGWLIAGIFQGAFTFLMTYSAINNLGLSEMMQAQILMPAFLSTCLLWGSYPMTQVYQHKEDKSRGDRTISVMLGVPGTFYFTAVVFMIANLGFVYFFVYFNSWEMALLFQLFLLPILAFFTYWFLKVKSDDTHADFRYTMRLNTISAVSLNAFFLVLYLLTH